MPPPPVDLSGVPETLLGNLGRRAAAARAGALRDPMAIQVVDQLDYDFAELTRGALLHAVRVATFDKAVHQFLVSHPTGTVVALGEGLETQFWRVDNGQMRWLTVDLPETMQLRRQLLRDGPRQSSHQGSALDLRWLDALHPADAVLVTTQGARRRPPWWPREPDRASARSMAGAGAAGGLGRAHPRHARERVALRGCRSGRVRRSRR
jgi:O-methyltransferase involved in polyketide biosynthesis